MIGGIVSRWAPRRRRALWSALMLGALRPLFAQDTPPTAWAQGTDARAATTAASWFGAWSPLRPIADAPRGLLRAPLAPGLLDAPRPPVGAFILSGAPGAIARDLRRARGSTVDSARYGELRLRYADADGPFKRPLDATQFATTGVNGAGWSPVGAHGVAIGRFVVEREQLDVSSFTGRVTPYGLSPFLATDSVTPPTRRTRARLEGALGTSLGGFGVGLAMALESRDHNTIDFPLRRSGRSATPAAIFGLERTLPWLGLRVGAFRRWTEPRETDILNAAPLPTVYYPLRGYAEPVSVPITQSTALFMREERRATATGGTLEFGVAGTSVVVTHESGRFAEDSYFALQRVRPTNRWRATGSETRAQVTRSLGPRTRAMLIGVREEQHGDAVRFDLDGIAYRGRNERVAAEGDIRSRLGAFDVALTAGMQRVRQSGTDYAADRASTIEQSRPFGAIEAARRVGRLTLAAGASMSRSSAVGTLPTVADAQENYQRLLAPALAYEVAEATAQAWWLTGRVPLRSSAVVVGWRSERTSSGSAAPQRLQPTGRRTGSSVTVGVQY